MLNELVEFGKKIRDPNESDALKQELVAIDIVIDAEGNFKSLNQHDDIATRAEALTSKKGKARLLLDKAEETLGFDEKKHELFLNKLHEYQDVPSIKPVLRFYGENKSAGQDQAAAAFLNELPEKNRKGNLAFLILGESRRLHEKDDLVSAIIEKFEAKQQAAKNTAGKLCSICGSSNHPIGSGPHGMIKKVPDGNTMGCALVSYNEKAFESYGLEGNKNSSICSVCARNYVEGLNYLLGNGVLLQSEKGKTYMRYSNRQNMASDAALIYWTKNNTPVPELDLLENAGEREADIFALIRAEVRAPASGRDSDLALLLDSPYTGRRTSLESVDADRFYSCILSGAAARIAVRSWLESTAPAVKNHIAEWFHDIAVMEWNNDRKAMTARFFSLRELSAACGAHRKKEQAGSVRYELDKEDNFLGRASVMLWNCAILGQTPPFTLLDRVLRRVRTEGGRITAARVGLLKLILNRSRPFQTTGARRMKTQLDQDNASTAYVAGRIFAMLESIQIAALGKDLNAPIRDRFFSFASTSPAPAFGRLLKLSQSHLGKIRGEKPGLAAFLDKKLGELFQSITRFPLTFTLEEQGQFAIGYYHQRQANFTGAASTNNSDAANEQGE